MGAIGKKLNAEQQSRVDEIMKKTFGHHQQFKSATHESRMVEDDKSYWSQILRTEIHWPAGTNLDAQSTTGLKTYPRRIFIKLPIVSAKVEKNAEQDENNEMFQLLQVFTKNEAYFYKEFGNKKYKHLRIPGFYYAEPMIERGILSESKLENKDSNGTTKKSQGTGSLVLEDMLDSYGNIFAELFVPGFSIDQVMVLAEALAGWHYSAISNEDRSWVDSMDFAKDLDFSTQDMLYNKMLELVSYDDQLTKKAMQLKPLFTDESTTVSKNFWRHTGMPPVLTHCDLNATNILWTKHSNQTKLAAIIDFQMVTVGSFCEDIVRILTLGVSCEDRRKITNSVLRRYYDTLCQLFNGPPPFTFEQVLEEYDRVFSYACTFGLFGLSCYYDTEKQKQDHENFEETEIMKEMKSRARGMIDDSVKLLPR